MATTRVNVRMSEELAGLIRAEAVRLDRSVNWVVVRALRRVFEEVPREVPVVRPVRDVTPRFK